MCPQQLYKASPIISPQPKQGFSSPRSIAGILFVFVFSLALASVYAQNRSEEYAGVKDWLLPDTAVAFSELQEGELVITTEGKPFSGVAYERYPNGRLLRAMELKAGKKHGLLLVWYPDGTPQMSVNYREGILHGRFLGWYNNGSVIYDMTLNNGTYAGDSMLDNDDSRSSSETDDSEREGPDNDQSRE